MLRLYALVYNPLSISLGNGGIGRRRRIGGSGCGGHGRRGCRRSGSGSLICVSL
jgi:hypothetical protein